MMPGLLRKIASLQRATESLDASGSVIKTWEEIARRRLDMRPIKGREYLSAGKEIGEVSHTIRLRIDSTIADLSRKDRIVVGGRVVDIVVVRDVQERGREFEIMGREVV